MTAPVLVETNDKVDPGKGVQYDPHKQAPRPLFASFRLSNENVGQSNVESTAHGHRAEKSRQEEGETPSGPANDAVDRL